MSARAAVDQSNSIYYHLFTTKTDTKKLIGFLLSNEIEFRVDYGWHDDESRIYVHINEAYKPLVDQFCYLHLGL